VGSCTLSEYFPSSLKCECEREALKWYVTGGWWRCISLSLPYPSMTFDNECLVSERFHLFCGTLFALHHLTVSTKTSFFSGWHVGMFVWSDIVTAKSHKLLEQCRWNWPVIFIISYWWPDWLLEVKGQGHSRPIYVVSEAFTGDTRALKAILFWFGQLLVVALITGIFFCIWATFYVIANSYWILTTSMLCQWMTLKGHSPSHHLYKWQLLALQMWICWLIKHAI